MSVATRSAPKQALGHAVALHRNGELGQAIDAYRRICRAEPCAWQPLHLLGIALFQIGALDEAHHALVRVLGLNPGAADACYYLAEIARTRGDHAAATAGLERALQLGCRLPMAAFRLGEMAEAACDLFKARDAYEQAVSLQEDFVEAQHNLGNLLRRMGEHEAARRCLVRAVTLRPRMCEAHVNLGLLLLEMGDEPAALEHLRHAVAAAPESVDGRLALAVALTRTGELEEAATQYAELLAAAPSCAQAWNNLAVIYLDAGRMDEAHVCLERAVAADPGLAEAYNNLGNLQSRRERFGPARRCFARAIALRGDFPEAYNGLGMAAWEEGDGVGAREAFEKALVLRPGFAEAAANVGVVYQRNVDLDQAHHWYARSLQQSASGALAIRAATMLPPIMLSREQIDSDRMRLAAALSRLVDDPPPCTESDVLRYPEPPFYLAYHGQNDRDLLRTLAQVYARACPSLETSIASRPAARTGERRIRIGFVSRFFYNHSVGNFFNPVIEYLARSASFDVHLFSVGYRTDNVLARVASACAEHVTLDPGTLDAGRQAIAARDLDVLVYADIGMDPYTYFLSFSRLAPVQCVLQGHSDTSGVPAVDYFISSRLIEPDGAQDLYAERLLLLDTLPMHLEPEPLLDAIPDRSALGLPTGRLYLCPMRLQKVHPDMDALVAQILLRDREGHVAFFSDQRSEAWAAQLQARVQSACGAHASRVLFLPFEPDRTRFRAMMASAQVVLDTPHHGGGTTSNLALSAGTPIVSLVGATCRGRGPSSYYGLMGIDAGLAYSAEAYVERAVAIAASAQLRDHLSERILANLHRLYDNEATYAAYAALLSSLASHAGKEGE